MFSKRSVMRVLTALIVVGTLGVLTASASTYATGPLRLASSPSPFANCTIGASGAPNEVLYVNAEVEPWVAVNPTNPKNIIGVFQQDRWSNGGAHGLVTSVTHNGGKTWS